MFNYDIQSLINMRLALYVLAALGIVEAIQAICSVAHCLCYRLRLRWCIGREQMGPETFVGYFSGWTFGRISFGIFVKARITDSQP